MKRPFKFNCRPLCSALTAAAIASGTVGIVGSGIAGLIAGSQSHQDRASTIALLCTSVTALGLASAITLSMTHPED